jgi:hypothetical protein
VTGEAGFIDHHLVRGLIELGHEAAVLDDLVTCDRARLAQVMAGLVASCAATGRTSCTRTCREPALSGLPQRSMPNREPVRYLAQIDVGRRSSRS